jgi:hypothetical protein
MAKRTNDERPGRKASKPVQPGKAGPSHERDEPHPPATIR